MPAESSFKLDSLPIKIVEVPLFTAAPIHHRFFSFGIDLLIISFFQFLITALGNIAFAIIFKSFGLPHENLTLASSLFSYALSPFLFFSYFTLLTWLNDQTVGKMIFDLHVRNDDLTSLSFKQSFFRASAYLISIWTYGFGFFLAYFRKDSKTLHDLICKTSVQKQLFTDY